MKKSKAILMVVCAMLLVAASIMGTLAYLTSTDEVVNTFSVGKVAIKLDEAKANADGTLVDGADRVDANSYKLMPGHTYAKDPMVTVIKDSEPSYIRMLVTISKASQLKAVFGDNFLPESFVNGWDNTAWPCVAMTTDETANTITCEFRYKETVGAPDADVPLDALFDSITVPGTVTNDQLDTLEGLTITVVAQAIQADSIANADAAWAAFKA